MVHGSSQLIQSLLKSNLIDEMTVWTFPLLLRQGKKLFTEDINAQGLELVQNTVSTTGVIISTYRLNKEIKPGSFEFDQATD